jgi:hypothetical protein
VTHRLKREMSSCPAGPALSGQVPEKARASLRLGELIVIVGFVALNLAVPLATTEFYPFSRFPMYIGVPQQVAHYRVTDPLGCELPATDSDLQLYTDEAGHGFVLSPMLNKPGVVPDGAAVTAWVEARLAAKGPSPAFVDVVREVFGPVDSCRFGLLRREKWRIRNPRWQTEGRP